MNEWNCVRTIIEPIPKCVEAIIDQIFGRSEIEPIKVNSILPS
jgi:hypothetical protein